MREFIRDALIRFGAEVREAEEGRLAVTLAWDETANDPETAADAPLLGGATVGSQTPTVAEGGEPEAEGGEPEAEGGEPEAEGGEPEPEGGEPEPEGGEPEAVGGEPQTEGDEVEANGADVEHSVDAAVAALNAQLGRPEFEIAFSAEQLVPGSELVAPGSHLLRVLEALLAPRGRRSYVVQPAQGRLSLKLLGEAGLKAARGLALKLEHKASAEGVDLYVVYRLHYLTLERLDTLECVHVRIRPGLATEAILADPPEAAAGWEVRPRKRTAADLLEPGLLLADETVSARAVEESKRLAKEARQRLGKDATRLHAYYSGQIAEYERRNRRRDLAMIRIEELEEERELRIRELVASTHVSVQVEPLQLLEIEVPLQSATLLVHTKEEGVELAARTPISLDRHTGQVLLPGCPACGDALTQDLLGACAQGHVVHAGCTQPCPGCERPTCTDCGQGACQSCEEPRCPGCLTPCRGCEAPTCQEHHAVCALCKTAGCGDCLKTCAACGQSVCVADRHQAEGTEASFCATCAAPCPGCKEPTPVSGLSRCATCGRKFCRDCHPRDAAACKLCQG